METMPVDDGKRNAAGAGGAGVAIQGASEHNLKALTLTLPRRSITVLTGVSGAGKSSLAFDTVAREGRRRFLESLSPRARSILGGIARPRFESISALPPTVAVEPWQAAAGRRATIGTLSGVHDDLRLLFARLGSVCCTGCGRPLEALDADAIARRTLAALQGRQALVAAPLAGGARDATRRQIEDLLTAGFRRLRIDGRLEALDPKPGAPPPELARRRCHRIEVVLDRVRVEAASLSRLTESIEQCLRLASGRVAIIDASSAAGAGAGGGRGAEELAFSTRRRCDDCGLEFPEPVPGLFSFHSPLGACPSCRGTGRAGSGAAGAACRACAGDRLRPEARAARLAGRGIGEISRLSLDALRSWLGGLELTGAAAAIAEAPLAEAKARLGWLIDVGLGHLTLSRAADGLSSGEQRRARLATLLGSKLCGLLAVIDQPSAGLHARDADRILDSVTRLRDRGNTVLLVEPDLAAIGVADRVVEIGPGAGEAGGRIVAAGAPAAIRESPGSLSGAWLRGERRLERASPRPEPPADWIEIRGARLHNLRDLDVRIPLGRLVALSGVSGSGKSSLALGVLAPCLRRALAGRRRSRPPGASWPHCRGFEGAGGIAALVALESRRRRRHPLATPIGLLGLERPLGEVFASSFAAKARGLGAARFMLHSSAGRCPACRGRGRLRIDMAFLADLDLRCDSCHGRRFAASTLEASYRGRSIAQVFEGSLREARELFADQPALVPALDAALRLDLGHLAAGQPAAGLSNGELARLRLARALASGSSAGASFFILDEPSVGLHPEDLRRLLAFLDERVARGDTVLFIDHCLELIGAADHVIDLGPEGGPDGGRLVACGGPEAIIEAPASHTGRALARRRSALAPSGAGRTTAAAAAADDAIDIRGARRHNLRALDVRIPRNAITVITGVSGSGKSSLAVDVIAAEGRRQYLEVLAPQARGILGRRSAGGVDAANGLSPTLTLAQSSPAAAAAGTVATLSDVDAALRLLYARAGRAHCPVCGEALASGSPGEIAARLLKDRAGRKGFVLAPILLPSGDAAGRRDAALRELVSGIRRGNPEAAARLVERFALEGASRFLAGDEEFRLDDRPARLAGPLLAALSKPAAGLSEVVDRLSFDDANRGRLLDSIERAFRRGGGWAAVRPLGEPAAYHSIAPACPRTCFAFAEAIEPELFSFRSRAGACPACRGSGAAPGAGDRPCPDCGGARLCREALRVRVGALNIAELAALAPPAALAHLDGLQLSSLEAAIAAAPLVEIRRRLEALQRLGLGYLSLDRRLGGLSAGELQRVRLASQLFGELSEVIYVLDEPTLGLHGRDTERLSAELRRLRDAGNTVIVVEHDLEVIAGADHVLELGPGAGARGGEVVFAGPPAALAAGAASITAPYLRGERRIAHAPAAVRRRPRGALALRGVRRHNLHGLDVEIPLGVLVGVSGVSGSGKSTLILDELAPALRAALAGTPPPVLPAGAAGLRRVVLAKGGALGRSPSSMVAGALGIWDPLRRFLARLPASRVKGFGPGRFSLVLAEGRCAACRGRGAVRADMEFLPDLWLPCESCGGERFNRETLSIRYRGLSPADILRLEAAAALELLENHARIAPALRRLDEIGLGYLRLGQSTATLSGGERRRLQLARDLAGGAVEGALYIFDEPTAGLHIDDVRVLLAALDRLVDGGASVIAIEHHLEFLAACDWLIDLGPEAGDGGGRIVASGTPEEVAAKGAGHTARHLSRVLGGSAAPAAR